MNTFNSVGIMQPYLFPYLGYFSIIKHTDRWVVFDTAQYVRKGWINRNRILKQGGDNVGYITIPVKKASRNMLIKDALIDDGQNWKDKIMGQLTFYQNKAPFYNITVGVVNKILDYKTDKISRLNVFALDQICEYLSIPFEYKVFSDDSMGIDSVNSPDEWALEISKNISAKTYINAPGGKDFFNPEKYKKKGVELKFLSVNLEEYDVFIDTFKPRLSIIDVMMFNTPEKINEMLDNYEFI